MPVVGVVDLVVSAEDGIGGESEEECGDDGDDAVENGLGSSEGAELVAPAGLDDEHGC